MENLVFHRQPISSRRNHLAEYLFQLANGRLELPVVYQWIDNTGLNLDYQYRIDRREAGDGETPHLELSGSNITVVA